MKDDQKHVKVESEDLDKKLESDLNRITHGSYRVRQSNLYPGQGEYVPTYVSAGVAEK